MNEIARAIAEGFKVVGVWLNKSDDRRTRAFKKAAWGYVDVDEDEELSDNKREKLKEKYKDRLRAYN